MDDDTSYNGFLGIDGCKDGYVAVHITEKNFNINIYDNIEKICLKYKNSKSIIVDMPIGLPESAKDIRPEPLARKILSRRASCVFNVPCRQAVYKNDYNEANEINKIILGKGLTKQTFSIINKIREIDEFLHKHQEFKNIILEAHPEVCFTFFNSHELNRESIYDNKKTKKGLKKRLDVLKKYYNKVENIEELIYSDPILRKIKDDVVDALCLAIVGKVGSEKELKTLPTKPLKDNRGIFMQIVYTY